MKKLNNKGQSLVIFVIILPLIIAGIDFFVESMNLIYNKNRIDNILSLACREENQEEYILKNDNSLTISFKYKDDGVIITTSKDVKSLLAKIVGINEFKVKNTKICEVQ